MKQLLNFFSLLLLLNSVQAQKTTVNDTHLLKHYYELKDALVNSDANTASSKITDVINASTGNLVLPDPLRKKLISAGRDLEKQRNAFEELSSEMYTLVKTKKMTTDTIYQDYCPMKKVYWLSSEPAIRNPYYGKMMLTCGNITQTIKP
ncbi:MAG: hypothetical protein JWQ30_1764 [Sediminibacterium sp.]|nr:hypothetical protein [Sediminibacterium sp.]